MEQFIQLQIKKLSDKEVKLYASNSPFSLWDLDIVKSEKSILKKLLSDFKKHKKL